MDPPNLQKKKRLNGDRALHALNLGERECHEKKNDIYLLPTHFIKLHQFFNNFYSYFTLIHLPFNE